MFFEFAERPPDGGERDEEAHRHAGAHRGTGAVIRERSRCDGVLPVGGQGIEQCLGKKCPGNGPDDATDDGDQAALQQQHAAHAPGRDADREQGAGFARPLFHRELEEQ